MRLQMVRGGGGSGEEVIEEAVWGGGGFRVYNTLVNAFNKHFKKINKMLVKML